MLFATVMYGQNTSYYDVEFGDTTYINDPTATIAGELSLVIAKGDSISGAYEINDQLIYIQVDSNWTASNIAFMIYNPAEDAYQLLTDPLGALVEYVMVVGTTLVIDPHELMGAKKVKFAKITSGSYVTQLSAATRLVIHTIRY